MMFKGEWEEIIERCIDNCHFEFPGSTHSIHAAVEPRSGDSQAGGPALYNTEESAHTVIHSLKIAAKCVGAAQQVMVFRQCYLTPSDFDDSRYDPSFSPLISPDKRFTGATLSHAADKPAPTNFNPRSRTGATPIRLRLR